MLSRIDKRTEKKWNELHMSVYDVVVLLLVCDAGVFKINANNIDSLAPNFWMEENQMLWIEASHVPKWWIIH